MRMHVRVHTVRLCVWSLQDAFVFVCMCEQIRGSMFVSLVNAVLY